jgi:hypothetical protein
MLIKLYTFAPVRKGDWVVKVSSALDQILIVAYHTTKYSSQVRVFSNEIEAVCFLENLLNSGPSSSISHDETK